MLSYEVKDTEYSFSVNLGKYSVMEIPYSSEHMNTPVSKENARKWADHFVKLISEEYPISESEEDKYTKSTLSKLLESDVDLDSDLFKAFILAKLLN